MCRCVFVYVCEVCVCVRVPIVLLLPLPPPPLASLSQPQDFRADSCVPPQPPACLLPAVELLRQQGTRWPRWPWRDITYDPRADRAHGQLRQAPREVQVCKAPLLPSPLLAHDAGQVCREHNPAPTSRDVPEAILAPSTATWVGPRFAELTATGFCCGSGRPSPSIVIWR